MPIGSKMLDVAKASAVAAVGSLVGLQSVAATNYDESKVGTYTLPDPLVMQDGRDVTSAEMWKQERRPEIFKLFQENQFGRSPGKPEGMTFDVWDVAPHALGGKATRKQVSVYFSGKQDGPKMDMLIYLPADAPKPVPIFLCLNFAGNETVNADPGIRLAESWDKKTQTKHLDKESQRGGSAKRWPIEKILARGYGIAVICYQDIEPDFPGGIKYGVRSLYLKPGQEDVAPDEWGAIGAWAWGASRGLDYLETDKDVDAKHVIMLGQSRLGKTALWEGASEPRFAMVIAANSGEGGASLSRRDYGETVKDLTTRFPYQFCANYKKYADDVNALPVDSHILISLVAPRPLYLSTGSLDRWSDPKGEFLAAVAAGPVYKLLGGDGLDTDQMPPNDQPIFHTLGYSCHTGKHEITPFDWECYLDFADIHLKGKQPAHMPATQP